MSILAVTNIGGVTVVYHKPQHRDVRKVTGELPPGMHVHHIDGNTTNNDPSNLLVLTQTEHMRLHHAEWGPEVRKAQHLWLQTPEGKAIVRGNLERARAAMPVRDVECRHCGKLFQTKQHQRVFCSENCKYLDRLARMPAKTCAICSKEFKTIDPRVITCSYKCGWVMRRRGVA